jgi:hypothetical protein
VTALCHTDNGVSLMAFTVPDFNLTCDLYSGPYVGRVLRIGSLPCNLAMGRRVQQLFVEYSNSTAGPAAPSLLVPAGTDARDPSTGQVDLDIVEVPAGSGRWYGIMCVDDVGKGFGNEYRLLAMTKIYQALDTTKYAGLHWPVPIP